MDPLNVSKKAFPKDLSVWDLVVRLATHLPSEDVLVVDEARGESLDGALVELGELLAEQQCGLAVHVRARR